MHGGLGLSVQHADDKDAAPNFSLPSPNIGSLGLTKNFPVVFCTLRSFMALCGAYRHTLRLRLTHRNPG